MKGLPCQKNPHGLPVRSPSYSLLGPERGIRHGAEGAADETARPDVPAQAAGVLPAQPDHHGAGVAGRPLHAGVRAAGEPVHDRHAGRRDGFPGELPGKDLAEWCARWGAAGTTWL